MAKETLRALDEDVERLLLAGGSVAGTDDGLNTRRDEIAALAAKVPALARVADQIGKVTGAKPRVATSELLTLATMTYQLRAAQAAPAKREGGLAGVPAVEPVGTPLSSGEIEPIYRALSTKGSGRDAVVTDAAERNAVKDLRLLNLWVNALGDSAIADTVADDVVPKLGAAAFPLIKAAFKIDGNTGDARRLACLVKLDPSNARTLVEDAITRGSPAVRGSALEQLAEMDIAAAEPRALAALANDRSKDVRRSAIQVLGKARSDAALEALLGALRDGGREVLWAVAGALKAIAHEGANARILALLTPEALDVKPYVPPKPKKGAKVTPAQQKAAQKAQETEMRKAQERCEFVERVLDVLGERKAANAETLMIELWRTHKHPDVRIAAGRALIEAKLPAGLAAVEQALEGKDAVARDVAVDALLVDKARAWEKLSPYFDPKKIDDKAVREIANEVLEEITYKDKDELDPRWGDTFLPLLSHKTYGDSAISILGSLEDKRAVEPLMAMVKAGGKAMPWEVWDALENYKDKRAVPVMLEVIANGKRANDHGSAINVLRELDDPAAIPAIRDWCDKRQKKLKKGQNDWQLKRAQDVLRYLERDRTLS